MPCSRSVEQHTNALADYLPGGRTFEAKRIAGSNLRQLLAGLAGELLRAQGYICTLEDEYLPDQTVLFLDEWESALGIPDDCFTGEGTQAERLRDIVLKLTAYAGIQTKSDFEALGVVFGIPVTVHSGTDVPELGLGPQDAKFTIVVDFVVTEEFTFPFTFPILFGDESIAILECLFNKLKPANVQVIFRQTTGFNALITEDGDFIVTEDGDMIGGII